MEEEFLCPLPCATVDRIGISRSISLIYIAHVAVIIRHNLRLYGLPVIIAEITFCRCVVDVTQWILSVNEDQFNISIWDNRDLPVIIYIYLCGRLYATCLSYFSNRPFGIEQKLN